MRVRRYTNVYEVYMSERYIVEMQIEQTVSKKVSTHGPRSSRRDEWRASKGLPPRRRSDIVNRQGLLGAKRHAGRAKRRR